MLEESLPAIWASVNSWFTPTFLFVLLNIVIGTIAVASYFGTSTHQHQETHNQFQQPEQPFLTRAPSIVLDRLKSISFHRWGSQELNSFPAITTTIQPPHVETQQAIISGGGGEEEEPEDLQPKSESESESEPEPEYTTPHEILDHHVSRTKSETRPASGEKSVNLPKKIKKSASAKSAFGHFDFKDEEEKIVKQKRPSTVREGKSKVSDVQTFGDDEEVDAKADDFINRFKNQLKLQRMDSIIRYKEMIARCTKQ